MISPTLLLFLKIALVIMVALPSHIHLRISLSVSIKAVLRFGWNCIKSIDQLGASYVFAMLILSIHKIVHLPIYLGLPLFILSGFYSFHHTDPIHVLLDFIPKYLAFRS